MRVITVNGIAFLQDGPDQDETPTFPGLSIEGREEKLLGAKAENPWPAKTLRLVKGYLRPEQCRDAAEALRGCAVRRKVPSDAFDLLCMAEWLERVAGDTTAPEVGLQESVEESPRRRGFQGAEPHSLLF